jgi:hypothetical protein
VCSSTLRQCLSLAPRALQVREVLLEEQWFARLKPIQKSRIIAVKQAVEEGQAFSKATTVFMKTDELLTTFDKFIPRLIFNVSPYYLWKLGLFVDNLTHHLTESVWSTTWRPFELVNGVQVSACFACGATSSQLNKYVREAVLQKAVSLLCMGDDTWGVNTLGTDIVFVENDFSCFDVSQRPAFLNLFLDWLDSIGHREYADLWRALYREKIQYLHRVTNTMLKVPRISQLYTGEPGTCLRNSFSNILISSLALTSDNPEKVYAEAGLVAKYKVNKYATFLRGVFLPNDDALLTWIRLPSFLLKFGKTMKDPLSMYPRTWPRGRKFKQLLLSQWKGYGDMTNCWFYRRIDKAIAKLCRGADPTIVISEEYKVLTDVSEFIPDDVFNDFVMTRYGISSVMLESYCDFVDSINTLPVKYWHPLMYVLERTDY